METRNHIGRYTLTRYTGKSGALQIYIPVRVGRALDAKGYKSADLYITDEGLLFVPSFEEPARRHGEDVDLPFA